MLVFFFPQLQDCQMLEDDTEATSTTAKKKG